MTKHDENTTKDNWQQVKTRAEETLTPEIVQLIDECRNDAHSESRLISVLHKVQGEFGYLAEERLDAVAQLLQVPAAKVSGVATFYHFFRLQPVGKYAISICMGTACYVRGAERVTQRFQEELGIEFGETTGDGTFSLFESRCLGTCGLAPVVMVNDNVHGHVTPDQVPALLEKYRSQG
ncbi:MAG: NADH-quinone oxidoreductase subunit NuoE [Lentisphaeria bacterium]